MSGPSVADALARLASLGTSASCFAAPVDAAAGDGVGEGVGHEPDRLVTPASTIKVGIALVAATMISTGELDGTARCRLVPQGRTPGPVGISLQTDEVELTVRDLLPPMLTISDNVATDALLERIGLETLNDRLETLGQTRTMITEDLASLINSIGTDAGFADYDSLVAHQTDPDDPPDADELQRRIAGCAALDPTRTSRTTAAESVALLRAIWTDTAGPAEACGTVRRLMGQQVTRHRIATGFGPGWQVAAKSGSLLGVVRNEVAVVTAADGRAYAVAIFTRTEPSSRPGGTDPEPDPARIEAGMGVLARAMVDALA